MYRIHYTGNFDHFSKQITFPEETIKSRDEITDFLYGLVTNEVTDHNQYSQWVEEVFAEITLDKTSGKRTQTYTLEQTENKKSLTHAKLKSINYNQVTSINLSMHIIGTRSYGDYFDAFSDFAINITAD